MALQTYKCLSMALNKAGVTLMRSIGDGHCLLYSMQISWNWQLPDMPSISLEEIKAKIFLETVQNAPHYNPYFSSDAPQLMSEMRKFLINKIYNQEYGDFVPLILANAFHVKIVVLDQDVRGSTIRRHEFPPTLVTPIATLLVHRRGDHFNGLDEFLSELSVIPFPVVIMGDFNIHVDQADKAGVRTFMQQLATANLQQHVSKSTHKFGHTLDLVMTREREQCVKSITVKNDMLSDHYSINFDLCFSPEIAKPSVKTIRKIKSMNKDLFRIELQSLVSKIMNKHNVMSASLDTLCEMYFDGVSKALDVVAPPNSVCCKGKPPKPWYDDEIHEARVLRRQKERKWKRSGLEIDRQIFLEERRKVVCQIDSAKIAFYKTKLLKTNPKDLYKVIENIKDNPGCVLPSAMNDANLCDRFSDFFISKISKVQKSLGSVSDNNIDKHEIPSNFTVGFLDFSPVSENTVSKVVNGMKNKSCCLDPLPTWLLKENLDILLPLLTQIINCSIETGRFPSCLKHAIVRPLLKKPVLEKENLLNYRPISNLSFIGKVIEKVVATQLGNFMSNNNLHDISQSAYKQSHSCETALLKVLNDTHLALDQGKCVLLAMLDLSAAFDLVNHDILATRLQTELNITGTVLAWMNSYLRNRSQSVIIGSSTSARQELLTGVPKAQSWGPFCFLFTFYPSGVSSRSIMSNIIAMLTIYSFMLPLHQSLVKIYTLPLISWNVALLK